MLPCDSLESLEEHTTRGNASSVIATRCFTQAVGIDHEWQQAGKPSGNQAGTRGVSNIPICMMRGQGVLVVDLEVA